MPIGPDLLGDRAQVTPQLLEPRAAPIPVAVVGVVNSEVGKERERRRAVWVVDRVRRLAQPESVEPTPLRVGEEEEAGTEPGTEGGLHLRRIDADNDQLGVC